MAAPVPTNVAAAMTTATSAPRRNGVWITRATLRRASSYRNAITQLPVAAASTTLQGPQRASQAIVSTLLTPTGGKPSTPGGHERIEVDDVDHWLSSPLREEVFGPLGITTRAFKDPQGSNRVGLMVEIPDFAAFQEFMQTEPAAEAMKHDGVRPETLVILAEG